MLRPAGFCWRLVLRFSVPPPTDDAVRLTRSAVRTRSSPQTFSVISCRPATTSQLFPSLTFSRHHILPTTLVRTRKIRANVQVLNFSVSQLACHCQPLSPSRPVQASRMLSVRNINPLVNSHLASYLAAATSSFSNQR